MTDLSANHFPYSIILVLKTLMEDMPAEAVAAEIGVDYATLQKAIQGKDVAHGKSMSKIASWIKYRIEIIKQKNRAKRSVQIAKLCEMYRVQDLSLIHISEPTRPY